MEKIKITFTYSQFAYFGEYMYKTLFDHFETLDENSWLMFYNCRRAIKKISDKIFMLNSKIKSTKEISISFDINEGEALRFLIGLRSEDLYKENTGYETAICIDFIAQREVQIQDFINRRFVTMSAGEGA